MRDFVRYKTRRVIEISVAFIPWLTSMYFLYWLDNGGAWSSDTPHRGKISFVVLVAGMSTSFILHTIIVKRRRR